MPIIRKFVPFGEYAPDVKAYGNPGTPYVKNVLPFADHYKPFPQLSGLSTTPLDSRAIGALSIKQTDGTVAQFAGTRTKLYKLVDSAFTDVTRSSGGDYAAAAMDRWTFLPWSDGLLIALNGVDDPQKINPIAGSNFEALGGSPPVARYGMIVANFVVMGNLSTDEAGVQWSGLNDAEGWTTGTNLAGEQPLAGGGSINGMAGGEVGYVFQESAIRRMTFVGAPEVFQFDVIQSDIGLLAQGSLASFGDLHFFLSRAGFFMLAGDQIRPIGSRADGVSRVDASFFADVNEPFVDCISSTLDPVNKIVMWAYPSKDNDTRQPDRLLAYNWAADKWSYSEVDVDLLVQSFTPGYTLEGLNSVSTTIETLQFSLDSSVWAGGAITTGAIGTDHNLGFFEGENMAAEIETAEADIGGGSRVFINGFRPKAHANDLTGRLTTRERLGDVESSSAYEAMNDFGVIPAHKSARYFRSRIMFPEGSDWKEARGVEYHIRPEGLQ